MTTFQNQFEQKLEDKINKTKKTAFIESISQINMNEAISDIKEINHYASETNTSIETIIANINKAEITKIEMPERIQTPMALTNGQVIAQTPEEVYRQPKIFDVLTKKEISKLPEEISETIATPDGRAISLNKKGTAIYDTLTGKQINNFGKEISNVTILSDGKIISI